MEAFNARSLGSLRRALGALHLTLRIDVVPSKDFVVSENCRIALMRANGMASTTNNQRDLYRAVCAETSSPLVSIIILTYDNIAFIDQCLRCATKQDYHPLEIIVVDQASHDGTPQLVRDRFSEVTLIQNERNTGFSAGMNRGIKESHGDYVLLLNSDLFLHPGYIGRAVEQIDTQREQHVGMVAGIVYRHCNGVGTDDIDALGFLLVHYHAIVDVDDLCANRWVLGPPGAAMFLRRDMLEDVRLPSGDYLDSSYFFYGEDLELALRAQLFGWRCRYSPVVVGWHIGSASVDGMRRFKEKPAPLLTHTMKNRYLTLLSCYPLSLFLWMLPWNIVADVGQLAVYTFRRDWRSLRCMLSAYRLVGSMAPQVVAKRRWVQRRRRVSSSYLRTLFVDWGSWRILQSLIEKS